MQGSRLSLKRRGVQIQSRGRPHRGISGQRQTNQARAVVTRFWRRTTSDDTDARRIDDVSRFRTSSESSPMRDGRHVITAAAMDSRYDRTTCSGRVEIPPIAMLDEDFVDEANADVIPDPQEEFIIRGHPKSDAECTVSLIDGSPHHDGGLAQPAFSSGGAVCRDSGQSRAPRGHSRSRAQPAHDTRPTRARSSRQRLMTALSDAHTDHRHQDVHEFAAWRCARPSTRRRKFRHRDAFVANAILAEDFHRAVRRPSVHDKMFERGIVLAGNGFTAPSNRGHGIVGRCDHAHELATLSWRLGAAFDFTTGTVAEEPAARCGRALTSTVDAGRGP